MTSTTHINRMEFYKAIASAAVVGSLLINTSVKAGMTETYTTYCVFNDVAEKCIHTVTPDGYHHVTWMRDGKRVTYGKNFVQDGHNRYSATSIYKPNRGRPYQEIRTKNGVTILPYYNSLY